jgi:hypothetical protein
LPAIEARMSELIPEWERVKVSMNFTPNEGQGQFDAIQLEKSMVVLATERPDIYIVDAWQMKRLGPQTMYLSLEPWEAELRTLFPEERLIYEQFEEDTEPKLYGIDLQGSPVFEGLLRGAEEIIFTIRSNVEDPEEAMKLIRAMALQMSK